NTATASVLVKNPTAAINLLKQVGPSASGPWTSFLTATIGSSVYYKVTVENVGDISLSSVNVSDPTVSLTGCTWTDGDGTVLTALFTLPLADASNNQLAICVGGPVTVISVSHSNTPTAVDNSPGAPFVTDTSTATYGTPALTIIKSVTPTYF